jgi:hypothetical protein
MSLKLKRFSEAKQAQVEQLISYSQLLGLTGTDLISIGGKLEREAAKSRRQANKQIIAGFNCVAIGRNNPDVDVRFKLDIGGKTIRFELDSSERYKISNKDNRYIMWRPNIHEYDLPTAYYYTTKLRYALLLDLAAGKIPLGSL